MTTEQLDKLDRSKLLIRNTIRDYGKPCLLCSFGKDSLVLLEILRGMELALPIVFFREPFFPKKYRFANQVISDLDLTAYDFPPIATAFDCVPDNAHVINFQRMRGPHPHARMTGLVPFDPKKPFLCTLKDLIQRPLGEIAFPWDVCYHGHKSSDTDPVCGEIPLTVDVLHVPNSTDFAFPLRHWTDEDIWAFIECQGIPINHSRYEKVDGKWRDIKSKEFNPDYFHACWKCLDQSEPSAVICPKTGFQVNNVSGQIHCDKLQRSYMGKESK